MENYTKDELRSFLDRDGPPPASLGRKQIREWLEVQAVAHEKKRADEAELKLSDMARKLDGLRWVKHAFDIVKERETMASWSCKRFNSFALPMQ